MFVTDERSSDMTGFCSNGAAPPTCVPGTKWTPNDPLFFMHHAVRDISVASHRRVPLHLTNTFA